MKLLVSGISAVALLSLNSCKSTKGDEGEAELASRKSAAIDCKSKVELEVLEKETNGNRKRYPTVDARAKLVTDPAEGLYYRVELGEQSSEGRSSYSSPDAVYMVIASGSEKSCKVEFMAKDPIDQNCISTVRSAVKIFVSNGKEQRMASMDVDAKQSSNNGKNITYSVTVNEGTSDGASSTDFPTEKYSVTAAGSSKECGVEKIKPSKSK